MKNPFEINVEMLEQILSIYKGDIDFNLHGVVSNDEVIIKLLNAMINYNDNLSYEAIEDEIWEILEED
tara:strand:+ start:64 stop:267 length:204 start_codon:yes stop_codon:yes gene_type:complete